MNVEISMGIGADLFEVNSWWAKSPAFVLQSLKAQLEAAAAIWPELNQYTIAPRATAKGPRGSAMGGLARAASLSPERRAEIAKTAATTRWGRGGLPVDSAQLEKANADK